MILHGLFGMGDNWASVSKKLSESGITCIVPDLRNHGRSPHASGFSYDLISQDILELTEALSLNRISILGHSLGGKAAMFFTRSHPERVEQLIVSDIAPRQYARGHAEILHALNSVDLSKPGSRKEVEKQLRKSVLDEATLQFLLKNLYWISEDRLAWRFNLAVISENIDAVGQALPGGPVLNTPALFIRGGKSEYISARDEADIARWFSHSTIRTIEHAGHWVHADQPDAFTALVIDFLKNNKT